MNTHFNLQKLNPWNWFKHEEDNSSSRSHIPVKRNRSESGAVLPYVDSYNRPLSRLHQQMDELFDEAFRSFGFPKSQFGDLSRLAETTFTPTLNIASEDDKYTLTVEVPGMKEEDIEVELNGDMLTIRGNKREEVENKDRHFYRIERHYGEFQRVLSLPSDTSSGDIQAEMKNGLLTITVPRRPEEKSNVKKITINKH